MSGTIDEIEDRVVPRRVVQRRTAAARGWFGDVRVRVMGSSRHMGRQMSGQVSDTTQQLGDGARQVGETVGELPQRMQEATAGSPLIAGAVAFGVGALLGAVVPRTRREEDWAGAIQPQLGAVTDALQEAGRHSDDATREAAQEAAQEVRATAGEHAQAVGEQARDSAHDVKDAAGSS
jgi:methyl-accepting chemotaxis protein